MKENKDFMKNKCLTEYILFGFEPVILRGKGEFFEAAIDKKIKLLCKAYALKSLKMTGILTPSGAPVVQYTAACESLAAAESHAIRQIHTLLNSEPIHKGVLYWRQKPVFKLIENKWCYTFRVAIE